MIHIIIIINKSYRSFITHLILPDFHNAQKGQTACTACYNANLMVFYSSTLAHKKKDVCEVCDEGKVLIETSDECNVCPTVCSTISIHPKKVFAFIAAVKNVYSYTVHYF